MRLRQAYGLGIAILLAIANVADFVSPYIPEEWAGVAKAASSLIAAILVAIGYNSNPDGTPNTVSYDPKNKRGL